tara:strand:- start:301 stop:1134 length:834 start_codon:yes stop_codon:yes gene_type:complete
MKIKYSRLRKLHWSDQKKILKNKFNINISEFISQPYSFFKTVLYIELSSILVFFIQNTIITPNALSISYAILGLLSGVFLATNNENFILAGLIIIFLKGIVDWSDGLLARISKKTSFLGSILDEWGGLIGAYSFIFGFGFYLYNIDNERVFIFLTIFILVLRSLDLKNFFYFTTTYKLYNNEIHKIEHKKLSNKKKEKKYNVEKFIYYIKVIFQNFLDDRARSIDFICFLIFLDIFYIEITFLKYIFFVLAFKYAVLFIGSFYLIYFKDYIKRLNIK